MERRAFLSWVALALVLGCGAPRVAQGGPPARIVSLSPSTTEVLFALGLGERVVGVSRFCDYPEEAKSRAKVGGLVDLNFEAVLALRPDLVVGAENATQSPVQKQLEALGVQTSFPRNESLAEVFSSIRAIGAAAGVAQGADALASSVEAQVLAIKAQHEGKPRPRVLFLVGYRPLVVVGPGTFLDTIITYAGGQNAVTRGPAYPTIDLEGLLALQPEVIIDGSLEEGGDLQGRWGSFSQLPAVRDGRVFAAPSQALLRPGPRIAEGLSALASLLHPAP